ncbi:MAG: alpha-galactosidase [Puia sp.]|nr:alpha-galactosidase [Puia sp.]
MMNLSKKYRTLSRFLVASCLFSIGALSASARVTHPTGVTGRADTIVISTSHTMLVLGTEHGHLRQWYLGSNRSGKIVYSKALDDVPGIPGQSLPAYSTFGTDNLFTAAIRTTHTDGNPSLDLVYQGRQEIKKSDDITETLISLKDPQYPFFVILHYEAYRNEDVIRQWATIRHLETAPLTLYNFASANLNFHAKNYWLTQFHGDWAAEMQMQETRLSAGIKILDSKLGSRADMFQNPSFLLSLDTASTETTGEVLAGTLAWSGNFQLLFEVDNAGELRLHAGMNPYGSEYSLAPDSTFTTPAFLFTYSASGKGQASRNLERWARKYGVLDADKPRMVLLNNWEATYFDFDENKLVHLFDEAKEIGVDLFLLDDGWFANKYPRNSDNAGLGDWQENGKKLPQGIGYLTAEAAKRNVKFGIWVEPEMVNPKSELYERHPEWILRLPNRPESYYRNQLVLDLSNPAVQDFVFGVIDGLMKRYPSIAYFKWDCNRMFTDAYSSHLQLIGSPQSELPIEYVRGLYKVFARLRAGYPHLPVMLCSGGGGRVDYGALPYFTEFWPSDNTNPLNRVFIQWGYSYFFPAIATCAHVTGSGDYPLKFKMDVAMMGKMGFDMQFNKLKPEELRFVKDGIRTYKSIEDIVWQGDLYRLLSPYEGNLASLSYVSEDKKRVLLFNYLVTDASVQTAVPLQGLDPVKRYRVEEINLPAATKSSSPETGHVFTGAELMRTGIHISLKKDLRSAVFLLREE